MSCEKVAALDTQLILTWIQAAAFTDGLEQSPPTSLARLALSAADGQADATRLLVAIGEAGASVDALFEALEKLRELNDLARTKAFLRAVQKRLEVPQ